MGVGEWGMVTGCDFEPNREDDEGEKPMLQVQLTDEQYPEAVEFINTQGEDAVPADGTMVFLVELAPAFKMAFGVDDGIVKSKTRGERELYSHVKVKKQARIKLELDGTITISSQPDEKEASTVTLKPDGTVVIDAKKVEIAGADQSAARTGDEVTINAETAPDLFTYLTAVTAFTGASPPPDPVNGFKGKITSGSDKVKLS